MYERRTMHQPLTSSFQNCFSFKGVFPPDPLLRSPHKSFLSGSARVYVLLERLLVHQQTSVLHYRQDSMMCVSLFWQSVTVLTNTPSISVPVRVTLSDSDIVHGITGASAADVASLTSSSSSIRMQAGCVLVAFAYLLKACVVTSDCRLSRWVSIIRREVVPVGAVLTAAALVDVEKSEIRRKITAKLDSMRWFSLRRRTVEGPASGDRAPETAWSRTKCRTFSFICPRWP